MSGLESQYIEVPCTRSVSNTQFTQGVQDFPFSVGVPNVWYPKKSYFKVTMALCANGTDLPMTPAAMTAFADNAVGNLYDNVYFRGGEQDMSSLTQYCPQASALKVRLGHTLPWLKSMGAGVAINEASFMKRMLAVTQYPSGSTAVIPNATAPTVSQASMTNIGAYDDREIYKPVAAANFTTATVAISPLLGTDNAGSVAFPIVQNGGVVTGVNTLFLSGMPQGSNPTGGPVLPGDLLVVNGVAYELAFQAGQTETQCYIKSPVSAAVAATTNWFIVRSDTIRAPQAFNTVFALWQPPIGIFDYDEELGSGNFRIQLNPSSNYDKQAVETKNTNYAAASPYSLKIVDVRFYAYIEKKSLADSSRDLFLNELSIQSKPYGPNLQFSVPPSTHAISVFVQDATSGSSPLIPPSMFKVLDNGDLYLKNIQINYASITKPSTNWDSKYESSGTNNAGVLVRSGTLELQQRYHDSYEESGLELELGGMESFTDWLRRGPFYHFTFARDVNNRSTEVQLNLTYQGPNSELAISGTATPNLQASRVFIVAHYRNTVQIVTANGLIVSVAQRQV